MIVEPSYVRRRRAFYPLAMADAAAWCGPAASAVPTPKTILGATLVAWYRADLGITLNGSTVSAWADQSGNGHTATQGTSGNQFVYSASGGPNSQPVMVSSSANNTFMLASIGTLAKPCWVWLVYNATVANSNNYILDGGGANTLAVLQTGYTTLRLYAGSFVAWAAASLNAFAAYGLTFGSSGSIYSNAALEASGTTGTPTSTGLTIGGVGGGGAGADMQLAELVIANTPPAANALSAYSQARYGFG